VRFLGRSIERLNHPSNTDKLPASCLVLALRDILHRHAMSVAIGSIADIGWQPGLGGLVANDPPCGLTQLCALRYGAVPIVSRVGGLEDTVVDMDTPTIAGASKTGFKFAPVTTQNLAGALQRAHAAFRDKAAWYQIQQNGMSRDVSWRDRAARYADLYREIVSLRSIK
jgi:glycosyltransferase involved in cell wall biosynthesis